MSAKNSLILAKFAKHHHDLWRLFGHGLGERAHAPARERRADTYLAGELLPSVGPEPFERGARGNTHGELRAELRIGVHDAETIAP